MEVTKVSAMPQTKTIANSSKIDKDMFLQLLVAQMKYQDPMQPQSNTEYITQLATFSQLEQITNMANSFNMNRGMECIGKEVEINDNDEVISGIVDEVIFKDNTTYLKVNDNTYTIDKLSKIKAKKENIDE